MNYGRRNLSAHYYEGRVISSIELKRAVRFRITTISEDTLVATSSGGA
ncbi:MAG: hypothetical protein ACKVHE_19140 [Planctomycetales bacterium]